MDLPHTLLYWTSSVQPTEKRRKTSMAIRIIVPMNTLPGKGAEYIKARLPRHAEVRNDPGCEQFDLYQNVENPDQFLLVERWTDEEKLNAHYALNRPRIAPELMQPGGKQERYVVD
jgi:quinol monooxygenase YgiN